MASLSAEVLPKDETIRRATVDDYQAVLDIAPSLCQGLDYLPATFKSLVEGEGVKGYVYQKQDKVVGFLSTRVQDGGQTVMMSAGRIHPESRGRGLYGRFNQRVLREVTTSTNITHVVFTVSKPDLDRFRQRLLRQYYVVMEKKVANVVMDMDQIRMQLPSGPVHSLDHLQPLTYHQLHSMLRQPPSRLQQLFPQQRILISWNPYRVMADNMDFISSDCREHVFVAATKELELTTKGNDFPVTLLSSGGSFPSERGRVYHVDLFGSGSDEEIAQHLEWHFRRLADVAKEKSAIIKMFAERPLDGAVAICQRLFSVHAIVLPIHSIFVLEGSIKEPGLSLKKNA